MYSRILAFFGLLIVLVPLVNLVKVAEIQRNSKSLRGIILCALHTIMCNAHNYVQRMLCFYFNLLSRQLYFASHFHVPSTSVFQISITVN